MLKRDTNRTRRRAEPAIIAEQLLEIEPPQPGVDCTCEACVQLHVRCNGPFLVNIEDLNAGIL